MPSMLNSKTCWTTGRRAGDPIAGERWAAAPVGNEMEIAHAEITGKKKELRKIC